MSCSSISADWHQRRRAPARRLVEVLEPRAQAISLVGAASTAMKASTGPFSNCVPLPRTSCSIACFGRHRAAVGPGGGHGVVGVGNGDYARELRDVLGRDPVGVAGPVPALVVAADDRGDIGVALAPRAGSSRPRRSARASAPTRRRSGPRSSGGSRTARRSCRRRAPCRPDGPARTLPQTFPARRQMSRE